jgi:glutamine---fructose-6-phosphate transaminase (isomerizing)
MIEVSATNIKLRARLVRILVDASGADEAACEAALAHAGGDVKLAMVHLLSGGAMGTAREALAASGGSVRQALAQLDTVAPGLTVVGDRGRLMAADMGEQPTILRALVTRADKIAGQVSGVVPEPLAGVLIIGNGPSGHAGVYGRYLLEETTGRPVTLVSLDAAADPATADPATAGTAPGDAASGRYGPGRGELDRSGYLAIAVSESGHTPEVTEALDRLQRAGARGIAITNAAGSPLAAVAERVIDLAAGPRQADPATKSVTAQLMAFALLARAINPDAVDLGALASVPDQVEAVFRDAPARTPAAVLSSTSGLVSVGSGYLRVAAREMALKITETTSVLAAAYTAAELRHGSSAALRPGLAVVGFGANRADGGAGRDLSVLRQQAARRGADWVEISPTDDAAIRLPAGLPRYVLPVLAVVRAHQLAWTAALMAGRDPDVTSLRPQGRLMSLASRLRAAGTTYPLGLGRRERALQRGPGRGQVALRERDEKAVNDRELRDAAGHGAGPEGGLPGRGQQDQVGDLGDRGPGEVRHRDRGRAVTARLAQRVDRVDRRARVREADGDVPAFAQRGRGDRHVRVRESEGGLGDTLQLHLQVNGYVAAGADAVDVDAARVRQRVDHPGQHRGVEVVGGVGHGLGVGVGDLLGDGRGVVVGVDVTGRRGDRRRVVVRHRPGQREAQFGVAAQADRAAETHDAGRRGAARPRQLGDVPPGHARGIVEYGLGDPALDRCQVRQQGPDRDQDPDVRSRLGPIVLRACLPSRELRSACHFTLPPTCRVSLVPGLAHS